MRSPTDRIDCPFGIARAGLMAMCAILILSAGGVVCAQASQTTASQAPAASTAPAEPKIPPDQLDSLVAPIALYPDPILAQVLVAATYPLELVQLQQWLEKNPNLKDKALTDAVMKQPWDPSIQAMAALPDVVKLLANDIQWTTDLGNAFLAQQGDVMDAVQRMRKKAQDKGALKSNEQMKVETQVVEEKTVIVVQSANPEVIYVPSYNPVVVYPPPVYPYPPIYYPPPPPYGYAATAAISFGVGVAVGAAWGHCGWGCGWGGNDIDIDINNNFNRNTNINNISGNRGGGNTWQHNPQHRGGAPYANKSTANKYGGTARGDSLSSRQSNARNQVSRQGGNMPSASNRSSGGSGSRGGSPSVSDRSSGSRGSSPSVSNRSSGGSSRDSIGGRSASSGSSSRGSSAFGSGGSSGSSARSSSSRGASSMSSSRGGSGRSGGGGRGRR
jgi:hypothetical protein